MRHGLGFGALCGMVMLTVAYGGGCSSDSTARGSDKPWFTKPDAGATGGAPDSGTSPDSGTTNAVTNPMSSDAASGIDLTSFPTRTTVDSTGGTVVVSGGPRVTITSGALGNSVTIGIRTLASSPASVAAGYTVLSPWYELATSQVETTTSTGAITLAVPAAPSSDALSHPGLQLLAIVDGITLPLDGTFDATSGAFRVELLGLPASFQFAVAFNPNIQTAASDEVLGAAEPPVLPANGPGVPWTTLDCWLVFDGNALKMDGAKKILTWARNAATIYSNAGLKEPFLRKQTVGTKTRWVIHLTTDGSYFSEGVAADRGLFGRQYMSVNRVTTPSTNSLGSGQASVAHEMMHAVFHAYKIPNLLFCQAGNKGCQRSYAGINEGVATSAGYWIDQGSPAKPRPNQTVRPLWWPFAWFTPDDTDTMYMNQDFFVYLLRVATLDNFRMHLEALANAVLPARGDMFTVINAYVAALDAAPTGFGGNFTQTFAWYAADRAYIRSADGWLWPSEPNAGTAGAAYVFDSSLFADESNIQVTNDDCTAGSSSLDCEVIIKKRYGLGPVMVSANLSSLSLPSGLAGKPLTGTFSAFTSGGNTVFTVFGEKGGKGSESGTIRSALGDDVTLANVGTDYTTVRMLAVPSGVSQADMLVEMSFAGETTANVWLLCEGASGSTETYGCIGWDGDNTFSDASDECLFAGYMTSNGEYTTKAACTAECVATAETASWRTCVTPS